MAICPLVERHFECWCSQTHTQSRWHGEAAKRDVFFWHKSLMNMEILAEISALNWGHSLKYFLITDRCLGHLVPYSHGRKNISFLIINPWFIAVADDNLAKNWRSTAPMCCKDIAFLLYCINKSKLPCPIINYSPSATKLFEHKAQIFFPFKITVKVSVWDPTQCLIAVCCSGTVYWMCESLAVCGVINWVHQ